MEDFIKGLQGEIKRLQVSTQPFFYNRNHKRLTVLFLQDLTNDLQMQLILNGVNYQAPE